MTNGEGMKILRNVPAAAFVAWRGVIMNVPLWKQMSFWHRPGAAHRVASIDMKEILARLAGAVVLHPDSKCVLVGHSMGGAVPEAHPGPWLVALSAEHDVVTQKAFPFGQFATSLFRRYHASGARVQANDSP